MSTGRGLLVASLLLLLGVGGWFFFQGSMGTLPGGGDEGGNALPADTPSPIRAGKPLDGSRYGKGDSGREGKALRKAVPPSRLPGSRRVILEGRVIGPGGGGLPGAEVRLDRGGSGDFPFFFIEKKAIAKAETGPGGKWKISLDRPAGEGKRIYQVTALKAGYVPGRGRLTLEGKKNTFRAPDIQLQLGTQVWGRVLEEKGRPVKDASVQARGPGSFHTEPVVTDAGGRYSFPGFPAGKLRLTVDAKGFALAYRDLQVAPAAYPLQVDFYLTRGLSISGRVLDGQGRPIQGAEVQLERFQGGGGVSMVWMSQEESAKTDAQGRFLIGGLEEKASFRLRASAPGFLGSTSKKVKPGAQGILFTLERGCGVKGKVLDYQGKPVFPFFVEGVSRLGGFRGGGVRIQGKKDGTFFKTGLRPGKWSFRAVRGGGLHSPHLDTTLGAGDVADLGILRLPRPASLVVTVLDRAGKPISGARVEASLEEGENTKNPISIHGLPRTGLGKGPLFFPGAGKSPEGKTGKDGVCRLEDLSPGAWSVKVEHKDFTTGEAGPFLLTPGGGAEAEVRLSTGGNLEILVLERSGKPREGASLGVRLLGKGKDRWVSSFTIRTGPAGKARKDHLQPGEYQVRLKRIMGMSFGDGSAGGAIFIQDQDMDGKKGRSWKVRVEEGKTASLRITAPGRWKIRGIVQDAQGPARGVKVRLSPRGGIPFMGKTVRTGPGGAYTLDKVEAGSYVLSWGRPGCAVESKETIELSEEGGTLEKDLSLPSGAIRGRAVDAAGKPLSGLLVEVGGEGAVQRLRMSVAIMGSGRRAAPFLPDLKVPEVRTDSEGRFLLREVPAGTWTVAVKDEKEGKALASKKVKVLDGRTADAGDLRVKGK